MLKSLRLPLAPHRRSPPREDLDDVFIDLDPMSKRARQSGGHGFSKGHDIALGSKQRVRAVANDHQISTIRRSLTDETEFCFRSLLLHRHRHFRAVREENVAGDSQSGTSEH